MRLVRSEKRKGCVPRVKSTTPIITFRKSNNFIKFFLPFPGPPVDPTGKQHVNGSSGKTSP